MRSLPHAAPSTLASSEVSRLRHVFYWPPRADGGPLPATLSKLPFLHLGSNSERTATAC